MIRKIRIDGYKSFQGFELELRPLSVIFGPNASGKSNLLDAIYLLSRAVTCRNLKEAFEGHRGFPLESFGYGSGTYEELLRKDRVSFRFEVDVEISPRVQRRVAEIIAEKRRGIDADKGEKGKSHRGVTERFLRYQLVIEALPKTGYLRVRDERLTALKRNGEEKKRTPFLERRGQRLHLRMEGQAHPTYHPIGLDHTIVSTALYEPHYPHITAFRMELESWRVYYLEPRTLMREEVPLAEIDSLGPHGENLAAFLNYLQYREPKAFESLNRTLRRMLPNNPQIEVELLKEGRVGLRLQENGRWYSGRLISEGTLRLVGLLAAVHPISRASVVAYEEPENGVHPTRLKLIAELLKNVVAADPGKQILVTTHSPLLPEYFDDEQLFVCRKEEGVTRIHPFRTAGPLYRRRDIEGALEDRIVRGDYGG